MNVFQIAATITDTVYQLEIETNCAMRIYERSICVTNHSNLHEVDWTRSRPFTTTPSQLRRPLLIRLARTSMAVISRFSARKIGSKGVALFSAITAN